MARIPAKASIKMDTPQAVANILNVIRENGTPNYKNYVPKADPEQNNIRQIGSIIMDAPTLQNEFLSALINRIALVLVKSKTYENPLRMFKKGTVELGEVIEEVWVGMCEPFRYDIERSENTVFKREMPNVQSAFHVMNYQVYYKQTIQNADLQRAFLNWGGIENLISKIVEQMYTSANYDEWLVMKYMLARFVLNGRFKAMEIPTVEKANYSDIVEKLRATSGNLTFMSRDYNPAGVMNYTLRPDQYLIMTNDFNAAIDVNVLASAFNMDKVEFLSHVVIIDGFHILDTPRLNRLFQEGPHPDPNYTPLTPDELNALKEIPAVLVDRDWFMVYDNFLRFGEIYNPEGVYWNYTFHTWKTFSSSPFSNALVFVPGQPQVSGVTVAPTTATLMPDGQLNFTATVASQNFANKAVNWTVEPAGVASIDIYGNLHVNKAAPVGTQITVKATSVFDPSRSATAKVVVGAALTELYAVPNPLVVKAELNTLWNITGGSNDYTWTPKDPVTAYLYPLYNNNSLSDTDITSVSVDGETSLQYTGGSGNYANVNVSAQKSNGAIAVTFTPQRASISAGSLNNDSQTQTTTVKIVTNKGEITCSVSFNVFIQRMD